MAERAAAIGEIVFLPAAPRGLGTASHFPRAREVVCRASMRAAASITTAAVLSETMGMPIFIREFRHVFVVNPAPDNGVSILSSEFRD